MSSHKTFGEFLRCVDRRTRAEFRAAGKIWPVTKSWHTLTELKTADGKIPLKKIWDNLPYFYYKGRGEIQKTLQEGWEDHFVKDNSAMVAKGIESCVLSHGDRSDIEMDIYEPPSREEMERDNAEWRRKHDEADRQDLDSVAKAIAQYREKSAETNIQKRRNIVRAAAKGKPVERLNYTTCKKLDKQEIQIPETWRGEDGFSGTTWLGAYEYVPQGGRHIFHKRINNLLRKDRNMLKKDKKSQ